MLVAGEGGVAALAYSLGELLVCESSVPKPKRQTIRRLLHNAHTPSRDIETVALIRRT